ncbi:MAG: pyridoxal-phosphate dependent enzyme [Sulfurimonas sp.]|nr:pyridoxal-phosphate dependent enzyme [Sulfurimonas sp.]
MLSSPLSKLVLDGREFFVKRDDFIDPFLAGNKYRKLYTLLQTPKENYKTIISYGGTQSNAMLAIAAMCKQKGWHFYYYTKALSQRQKTQAEGNYFHALSLGMQHKELDTIHYRDFVASLRLNLDEKSYIIDQGGADKSVREGMEVLASEIRAAKLEIDAIATPSGTGTSALYLALALPEYRVYTTPCVGDSDYLKEQMSALELIPNNLIILEPKKKFHFAKPYPEFLEIYKRLLNAGVAFDLLYAPSLWLALLDQTQEKILYVHSGGVSGNESMLKRYEKKGLLFNE